MSLAYSCPKCGARPYQSCVSATGKPTNRHAARDKVNEVSDKFIADVARIVSRPQVDVRADLFTYPQVTPVVGPMAGAPDFDLEDAYRLIRNVEMGRTDDTIDPIQVVRDIVDQLADVKDTWRDPEEWDKAQNQIAELEEERDDLQAKLDRAVKEHDAVLEQALNAEQARDEWQERARALELELAKRPTGNADTVNALFDSIEASLARSAEILDRMTAR